jgi:hypothetical protein
MALVDRPDFKSLGDDEARVKLLYELVYQREPVPVEIKLGLTFVKESPGAERLPFMPARGPANKQKAARLESSFASVPANQRRPLTAWEKYAHALLQANEAMFVN